MRFLANEHFMTAGVRVLRDAGFDVAFIGEDSPSIKDWEVMEIAISTNRTILTHDRDYGELVFKHGPAGGGALGGDFGVADQPRRRPGL